MSLNRDLTVGKPGKVLLRFCLPLFASIIFQQLYNIADSFVAGKFIGNDALAAVGNSYEITLIFIAFAFGCNIGCSVIAAQLFGAKKFSDLKTLVYTVLISSGVLCVVLMTCGFLFGGALLKLIQLRPNCLRIQSFILISILPGCRSHVLLQRCNRNAFPQWAIQERLSSFWRVHQRQISAWIFCLYTVSAWVLRVLRGQPSFVRV